MIKAPDIKPIKVKEYDSKQSKYVQCGKLPMRAVILGPSGTGKTILLQNMILDIYRGCFERIYIFSPSIDVDQTWQPVKKYIEEDMHVRHTKEEPIFFSTYDSEALSNIISTQHKLTQYMKDQKQTRLYNVLVIIDDFADSPEFTRRSTLLHQLYIRGRHACTSVITATQVFKALSPIIRKNITELYVYRLRNQNDLEAWVEEVSAIYDKQTLLQLYQIATAEPYSFLFINLMAKNKNEMFYLRFDKKLIPE